MPYAVPSKRLKERKLQLVCSLSCFLPDTTADLNCIEPLDYLDFLRLMSKAQIVLTDLGGIQDENTVLNVPCVTMCNNTERPVMVSQGTNVLAATSKDVTVRQILRQSKRRLKRTQPRFWNGKAG